MKIADSQTLQTIYKTN